MNILIKFPYFVPSKTIYCIVTREEDQFIRDETDNNFQASPADPYTLLTESTVKASIYERVLVESWQNGVYHVHVYEQLGVSPSPTGDSPIGTGNIDIRNGMQVFGEIEVL